MIQPKITVVMPAYNTAKYIRAAIESVLRQDFGNFELIVVDDHSDDDTYRTACEFKKDPRVRVYRNRRRLHDAANRNRILKLARGRYIAPHDADDIMLQGRLRDQVRVLDSHPDVGVVFSRGVLYHERFHELRDFFPSRNGKGLPLKHSEIISEMPLGFHHCASLIRKELIFKAGAFDHLLPVGSDLRLIKRLFENTRFYFLDRLCLVYRRYERSTSRQYIKQRCRLMKSLFRKGKMPSERRSRLWELNFYLRNKDHLRPSFRELLRPGHGLFHASLLSKNGKGVLIFTAEDGPGKSGVSGAVPPRGWRPRAGGGDAKRYRPLTENGSRDSVIFSFLKQGFSYHSSEHARLLIKHGTVIGKGLLDPMVLSKPLKSKGRILREQGGQFWNRILRKYFLSMDLFRIGALEDECEIATILEIQADPTVREIKMVPMDEAQKGRLMERNMLHWQSAGNLSDGKMMRLLQRFATGYQVQLRQEEVEMLPLHPVLTA